MMAILDFFKAVTWKTSVDISPIHESLKKAN